MSIPSWAVKGAKVVCVDDTAAVRWADGEAPVLGAIYTIDRVRVLLSGTVVLDLVELRRHPISIAHHSGQCGYGIRRFRPLVTRTAEQDVSEHFAHHLHQSVSETEAA